MALERYGYAHPPRIVFERPRTGRWAMLNLLPSDTAPLCRRHERERLAEGLKAALSFSLFRLFAYTLLGLVAGISGEYMISLLGRTDFSFYFWILGGFFVSLLGVFMLLGRETDVAPCRFLMRHTLEGSFKSMGLLGFIVGITPCAPLLGILTYIAFSAETPMVGAFLCSLLRIGASAITPIKALRVITTFAVQPIRHPIPEAKPRGMRRMRCLHTELPHGLIRSIRFHRLHQMSPLFHRMRKGVMWLQIRGFGMHQPSHDFE